MQTAAKEGWQDHTRAFFPKDCFVCSCSPKRRPASRLVPATRKRTGLCAAMTFGQRSRPSQLAIYSTVRRKRLLKMKFGTNDFALLADSPSNLCIIQFAVLSATQYVRHSAGIIYLFSGCSARGKGLTRSQDCCRGLLAKKWIRMTTPVYSTSTKIWTCQKVPPSNSTQR